MDPVLVKICIYDLLPFAYMINVTTQEDSNLVSLDWRIQIADFYFNEPLTAEMFKVS